MKELTKFILITSSIILIGYFVINYLFFKKSLDYEPEITGLKESNFEFTSSKPFFYQVDRNLFYSADGKLSYNQAPIWKGEIGEAFISPDNNFALIYFDYKLTLIDHKGQTLFKIDSCTDLYSFDEERKSGKFKGFGIYWNKNSDFFLIAQDKIWENDFSKNNKSSIYKYSIADNSLKPFIELDETIEDNFVLSQDGSDLYYSHQTPKFDLVFKKVSIKSNKVIANYFPNEDGKFVNLNDDNIFINFINFKEQFANNSYDLRCGIFVDCVGKLKHGLYYKDKDKTVALFYGKNGYSAYKENSYSFCGDGFFLSGNRFFIIYINSKQIKGQLVIDTKTFKIMKLPNYTKFYFNINSTDCKNFTFTSDFLEREVRPDTKFNGTTCLGQQ